MLFSAAGGTGGAGGDFRVAGQKGVNGEGLTGNSNQPQNPSIGGTGGGTIYGAGGVSIILINQPGVAASGYGAGGSGGQNKSSQPTPRLGGDGSDGIIIITEYI